MSWVVIYFDYGDHLLHATWTDFTTHPSWHSCHLHCRFRLIGIQCFTGYFRWYSHLSVRHQISQSSSSHFYISSTHEKRYFPLSIFILLLFSCFSCSHRQFWQTYGVFSLTLQLSLFALLYEFLFSLFSDMPCRYQFKHLATSVSVPLGWSHCETYRTTLFLYEYSLQTLENV